MEQARHMKSVTKKGKRRYIIKTYRKIEDVWQQMEVRKIKVLSDQLQLIRIRESFLFSTRIHRHYKEAPGGLYEFSEFIGKQEVRSGSASSLIPLHLEGKIREYYPNGQLKTLGYYENNQLQSNQNWLSDGTEYYDNIFHSVDKEPEYSLGFGSFRNHILSGIEKSGYNILEVNEKIVLGWVILEDGTLAGAHKVSGKLELLPNIIIELIESLPGDWSPAILEGQAVRYYMTVPFNFMQRSEYFDNLELRDGVLIWD
jgi:hypothetical protein